jgi:hypothetical protein
MSYLKGYSMDAKKFVIPADSTVSARLSTIPIPATFFIDRALALDELDRDRLCCSSLVHIVSKIVALLFSAIVHRMTRHSLHRPEVVWQKDRAGLSPARRFTRVLPRFSPQDGTTTAILFTRVSVHAADPVAGLGIAPSSRSL